MLCRLTACSSRSMASQLLSAHTTTLPGRSARTALPPRIWKAKRSGCGSACAHCAQQASRRARTGCCTMPPACGRRPPGLFLINRCRSTAILDWVLKMPHAALSLPGRLCGHFTTASRLRVERRRRRSWELRPSPYASPRGRRRISPLERSEEHTSELQSHSDLVCRLLLEKKKKKKNM